MRHLRVLQRAAVFTERPYANALVEATGCQEFAAWIYGDCIDSILGLGNSVEPFAGCGVPDFDLTIGCARDQPLPATPQPNTTHSITRAPLSAALFSAP